MGKSFLSFFDQPHVLSPKQLEGFQLNLALGPTQPPIQWVLGALSLGVKWQEREADHLPPSTTKVKNAWSFNSTPTIRL
jgi:hypothetical protein